MTLAPSPLNTIGVGASVSRRAGALFRRHARDVTRRTDRMFAVLMALQWLAAMALALWLSPRTWEGRLSQIHPHVWAAVLLGGAISSLPILLALKYPCRQSTRYVIAIAQMLWSALLILSLIHI